MEGGASGASRGIIPRAIEDVFATIGSDGVPNSKFLVRASYLQIYNEARSAHCEQLSVICPRHFRLHTPAWRHRAGLANTGHA